MSHAACSTSLFFMVIGSWVMAGAPAALPQYAARPVRQLLCSETFRADARLNDVCFVDPQFGWAVGDRGAIWHTADAGRNWRLQDAPTGCPLSSVWFADRTTGWAVGGSAQPFTHGSVGTVLWTRDGGQHWNLLDALCLPLLRQVRFFDHRRGWAAGASSAMFPSGLFWTDSAGRSWQPMPGAHARGWLTSAMLDPATGILAGRSGAVFTLQQSEMVPARTGSFGLRALRAMSLVGPVYGWLAGDGGLVMLTGDLGASWQSPPAEPPRAVTAHFDFAALSVRGPKCWVAGAPGTRVLHTADAGRSWQVFATGQSLPIRALVMADDAHGWAVGELGTILATTDGGQTWRRQRAGGTRAALLGVFGEPEDVPWELVGRLAGNDGYLTALETIARRDVEIAPRAPLDAVDRLHEAVVASGGSAADVSWQFPLRQKGLVTGQQQILDAWNAVHDGRGLAALETHLVRQIRLWRPDVIVTHDARAAEDPLAQLLGQAVLRAAQAAADATRLSEQITLAGLEPWRVKRIYAALGPGAGGSAELATAQLATRLGRSLADLAAGPRALVESEFAPPPATLGFRQVFGPSAGAGGHDDFFAGISLWPGGEARRKLVDPPPETLETLARIAQRRRNTEAIFQQAERSPQQGAQLAAQTGEMLAQLDADGGAWVLYHLARRYHGSGRSELAADTLRMLLDRSPDHPLARPAGLWLVQYYASGESAWRLQGGQRVSTAEGTTRAVRAVSALAIEKARSEDRPAQAVALAAQLEKMDPALFAEPRLRFPLAAAQRQQGLPRQADRYCLMLSRAGDHDAWRACAEAERWLAEPKGAPPKPLFRCRQAERKPRLDGLLEEPVWRQAAPAPLRSAQNDDADWTAVARLAYDSEFLYLALACREAPGVNYAATPGPRTRDAELSGRDRVEVLIDLDRDFVTAYRLVIDHRGWTAEDCWGDRTWNPTWYVAARSEAGTWTAEAAIPLEHLTGRYPVPRDVWALGIQRTIPGVGFQSWSTPASTEGIGEGLGYLIFE